MKIGFTGTQVGMTDRQKAAVKELLLSLKVTELHHGGCLGADFDVDEICGVLEISIVIHPPEIASKRAFADLIRNYTSKA
jgi:hypothetical protein